MNWQLAEAKNRFSEVVRLALSNEPQHITRRNDCVVVISEKHYQNLLGERVALVDYLMSAPSFEGLAIERDPSLMRDVEL